VNEGKGPRVALKRPRFSDMDFVRRLWADGATMAAVGGTHELDDESARRWFARVVDPGESGHSYYLVLDEAGEPVGEVSCHRMDAAGRFADLNLKILASKRGRGYGEAALRLFLRHFFLELEGRRLDDPLAPGNAAARRLLERQGFEHDASVPEVLMMRLERHRYFERHPRED